RHAGFRGRLRRRLDSWRRRRSFYARHDLGRPAARHSISPEGTVSVSVRVIITGRVQGVSYRAWTVRTADKLGLSGWVRNLGDGSVEAVFSGDEKAVQAMLEACRKGPMMARVDNIESFA